jgi:hypothetical protein
MLARIGVGMAWLRQAAFAERVAIDRVTEMAHNLLERAAPFFAIAGVVGLIYRLNGPPYR